MNDMIQPGCHLNVSLNGSLLTRKLPCEDMCCLKLFFSSVSSFSLSIGVWFPQVKNENEGFSILRGCNYLFLQHVMLGSTPPLGLQGF